MPKKPSTQRTIAEGSVHLLGNSSRQQQASQNGNHWLGLDFEDVELRPPSWGSLFGNFTDDDGLESQDTSVSDGQHHDAMSLKSVSLPVGGIVPISDYAPNMEGRTGRAGRLVQHGLYKNS